MTWRLLDRGGLRALGVTYSNQHLSRLEKKEPPQFPRRVELTPGGPVRWYENEVLEWIQSRPRGSSLGQPPAPPASELSCVECGDAFFHVGAGRRPKRCPKCRAAGA